MLKKVGSRTVAEVMKSVKNNAPLQSKLAAEDSRRKAIVEAYTAAERPLLEALKSVGITTASVWDMANCSSDKEYPDAIPILLEHLKKGYVASTRHGIALALTKKWARDVAWDGLLEAYRNEPNLSAHHLPSEIGAPHQAKVAMAEGLALMARKSDLSQLIELLRDRNNGPSRLMLVKRIAKSRDPIALSVLNEMRIDPELESEVAQALKKKGQKSS